MSKSASILEIAQRLESPNVTQQIRDAILSSAAFKGGEEMTLSTVKSMLQGKVELKECGNALAKMTQKGDLERIRVGVYKRPTNAKWLQMPWRRRSNQQIGICESYQFGVKV